MKKFLLLLLISIFFSNAYSQNNTVLWKISGNGITKASYLFGTVHLSDKRVFYTNDSLMEYISSCDYFASELHPDSLNAMMFGAITKNDTSDVYKKTFDSDDYERIDKKLKNDFGINLNQIKSKDLRSLKMLLNPHKKRKDDYPTFLDGYLMGIALRNGKTIIGLEGISSHEKALSATKSDDLYKKDIVEISKESKGENYLERLVKIYQEGNLGEIEKNYTDFSYDAVYNILDRRNKIMASSIDSILKTTTLFATCGAAHLVGNTGVIQLLIKKGYTLTPVFSKNRSYLSTSNMDINYTTWKTINSPNLGVNYVFPGTPGNVNSGVMYSDFKTYIDITSGITYMAFPIAAAINTSDKQKIFEKYSKAVSARIFGSEVKEEKLEKFRDMDCYRIDLEYASHSMSMRLFIENNILYIFSVAHPKTLTDKKEINHFFNNISLYKPIGEKNFHYKNERWGFEMDLPSKPIERPTVKKQEGKRLESLSIKSSDNVSGAHYIVETADIGEGLYFPNDSVVLRATYDVINKSERKVTFSDTTYLLQGNKCTLVKALFKDSSYIINYSILRGFKIFSISCYLPAASERQHNHDAFLNSFTFLPLATNTFKDYSFPEDSSLMVRLPQPWNAPTVDSTEYIIDGDNHYSSFDNQTCITYYIKKKDFGRYYYTLTDSVYWKKVEDGLLSEDDTLLSVKPKKIGAIDSKTFVIGSKTNTCITKCVSLDMGNYRYDIYSYMPKEKAYELQDAPFEFINYTAPYTKKIVSDTTALRLLVSDFYSSDSTLRSESIGGLYKFKITDNMFDDLKKILSKEKPASDSTEWNELNYFLISKLIDLDDKDKVLAFVKEKLENPKDSANAHDYLSLLAQIKTEGSYKIIKHYIAVHPSSVDNFSSALNIARDSMPLANILFPEVLKGLEYMKPLEYSIVQLISEGLRSGTLKYDQIIPYEPTIIKISDDFKNLKGEKGDFFSTDYNNITAEVLKYSTNKELVTKHFNSLSNAQNIWCRYYGNYYLAEIGQAENKKTLKQLAEEPYFRYKMFLEYSLIDRLDKMPSKYKTNEMLAEGNIYHSIIEYDEAIPETVKFISKYKTTLSDKACEFYLYKVQNKYDPENSYLYTAGPFYGEITDPQNSTYSGYVGIYEKGLEEIMLIEYLGKNME